METSWGDETKAILNSLLSRLSTKQKQLEETEKCLIKEREDLKRLTDQVKFLINLSIEVSWPSLYAIQTAAVTLDPDGLV